MNKKMKGKSEQRQRDESEEKGKMLKKNQSKKGLEKTKNEGFFCLFFLCFEVKREKDSNSFKNIEKNNGFFRAHIVFPKKKKENRNRVQKKVFPSFPSNKQLFKFLGTSKKRQ